MQRDQKQKVGYLGVTPKNGPPDTTTFGYMAAEKYFADQNDAVEFVNRPSHEAICKAVGRKEIWAGVVAVENVIHGMVNETVRAVEEVHGHYGVQIAGEVVLPIELFYMGQDANLEPKRVLSHNVAVSQCSRFTTELSKKGLVVETIQADGKTPISTGEAALEASQNGELACIASRRAEEVYGLQRIGNTGNIVDNPNSMTRFWVISKDHGDPTGHDKSCFLINLEQVFVGALYQTLGCFAMHGCNLLVAYPISIPGKLWEYTFLLEFEGHINDDRIDGAWQDLRRSGLCLNPIFLGSYSSVTTNITVPA